MRNPLNSVPKISFCHICGAPHQFLYFNDGIKRSQLKCKVCSSLSPLHLKHRIQPKHFCPYCHSPLRLYKKLSLFSIFKCYNNSCKLYLDNKNKLNTSERILYKLKPFEFKLHYLFREYHFSKDLILHSAPIQKANITNIRNSLYTLCLVLTFHISFALSARKTAYLLREVFSLKISKQSVINYCEMAAFHCHKFNNKFKGIVVHIQAGDETYIKVNGKHYFTFFFISSKSLKISAYHVHSSRDTLPAIIAIKEAIRTAKPNQKFTLITDCNPSYQNAVHFFNLNLNSSLKLKNVIGLQNLDYISEKFRPFKQLIERLNRTYKHHTHSSNGFASKNGAISLTTLFVTFYNFLRPHFSLNYNVPIPLKFLKNIDTLQGRWAAILQTAIQL